MRTIQDFAELCIPANRPEFSSDRPRSLIIADAQPFRRPLSLLPGAAEFAPTWLAAWHAQARLSAPRKVQCYFIAELLLSQRDHMFYQDALIQCSDFVAEYRVEQLPGEVAAVAESVPGRRTRVIDVPCVPLAINGYAYGHFLIESLSRLYIVRRLLHSHLPAYMLLVEQGAPGWMRNIIREHIGIPDTEVITYDSAHEHVLMKQAIFPGLSILKHNFHAFNNNVFGAMIGQLGVNAGLNLPKKMFISKSLIPTGPNRDRCQNDLELAAIAAAEFGFAVIHPETMPWPEQVRLFANAKVILGEYGSGLHNALFTPRGARVGVLHFLNLVQSGISALRQQHMAYMSVERDQNGCFVVDPDHFRRFCDMLLAGRDRDAA